VAISWLTADWSETLLGNCAIYPGNAR
jgi:hypothetical protein